ncbi:MAG TPA: dTDP-4-dehydrorhamnose reductase, partial [Planctomycetaceae bacterium]|nr:dTDP-4-dehydrorhamnose reductase [Planctomycetaceae bacterium]
SPWPLSEQWFPKTRQWHYEREGMDEAFGHEFLASVLYHRPG